MIRSTWDRAAEKYAGRNELRPEEAKFLTRYVHKTQRVLDVGCGTGRVTQAIAKITPKVIGIDLSPQMVKQAKLEHPKLSFKVMDAADLRFPNNSFDVVTSAYNSLDYLQPIERFRKAIKECNRVLKQGGVFYASFHYWRMPRSSFEVRIILGSLFRKGKPYLLVPASYGEVWTHYATLNTLASELRQAGFEIIALKASKFAHFTCRKR